MRRCLLFLVATVGVFLFEVGATWADTPAQVGDVPNATLAELGLGGMQRLSDADGEHIRGGNFTVPGYMGSLGLPSLFGSSYQYPFGHNQLSLPNSQLQQSTISAQTLLMQRDPHLFTNTWGFSGFPTAISTPSFQPIVFTPINFGYPVGPTFGATQWGSWLTPGYSPPAFRAPIINSLPFGGLIP